MPTNLPPEYKKVEKLYRQASTPEEKIEYLEEMFSIVPKHKGTDKLRAGLRKKLSKLKVQSESSKKGGHRESSFNVDKEGAGQIALVGAANTGKSSLVASLTNAEPEVAEYPFTTRMATPGMMPIENIQVQLIDTPALDREFIEPGLVDMIRRADIVMVMVDLQADPIGQLEDTIAYLDSQRIYPLEKMDTFEEHRRKTFLPFYVLVNKVDDAKSDEDFEVLCDLLEETECPLIPVSTLTGRHVEDFKRTVFELLGVIRIYSKAPGKDADLSSPYVMKEGSTVEEFAAKVHQDFYQNLKLARVWGSGEFDGQLVSRDYVLHDEDVLELRK
jgi:hypothetical protein